VFLLLFSCVFPRAYGVVTYVLKRWSCFQMADLFGDFNVVPEAQECYLAVGAMPINVKYAIASMADFTTVHGDTKRVVLERNEQSFFFHSCRNRMRRD
jgi:hypothetical protein